jgi:1,4-dihydroxy-2-naphthoyl-CoA hydrolase
VSEALSSAGQAPVTLNSVLAFETVEVGPELARAKAEIGDQHRQPYGIVHGGVYAALAESIASEATAIAVYEDGNIALGMSNFVSFMRPISSGTVHAEARRKHAGSTTWVWEVDMTDDQGRLCAASRVTVAVRPQPQERSPESGS